MVDGCVYVVLCGLYVDGYEFFEQFGGLLLVVDLLGYDLNFWQVGDGWVWGMCVWGVKMQFVFGDEIGLVQVCGVLFGRFGYGFFVFLCRK